MREAADLIRRSGGERAARTGGTRPLLPRFRYSIPIFRPAQEPAMTSPQDQEDEVTRLRRSFRVAIIAAAVGASIGAGVVMTVVGAAFSVMDRPASEASKTEKTKA